MPSIAQEFQDPVNSKKRRREDWEAPLKTYSLNSRLNTAQNRDTQLSPRTLLNLKISKRQRMEQQPHLPLSHSPHPQAPYYEFPPTTDSHLPPQDRGRERGADTKMAEHNEKESGKKNLTKCHICCRRPTAIQELDAFTNCEGCSQRCCWICVRECAGFAPGGYRDGNGDQSLLLSEVAGDQWAPQWMYGHRRRICSHCCVERGAEGEVWCLACMRNEGGG